MRLYHCLVLLLLSLVCLTGLNACGGGGGNSMSIDSPSSGTGDFADGQSFGDKGFSVVPWDFNTDTYDANLARCLAVDVTEDSSGDITVNVNADGASDLCLAYYQLTWPEDSYVLAKGTAGDFFQGEGLMAVDVQEAGYAEAGNVRDGFLEKGGISGDGCIASFSFTPGDPSRQSSVAVENEWTSYNNYDDVLENREDYYDGLDYSSSYPYDGVMFQAMSGTYINDQADLYFDPATFMCNFITYLPGDSDFNGEVTVTDITPLAQFSGGYFSIDTQEFDDSRFVITDEWADERGDFVSGSGSFYFLRWIDGDFSKDIDAAGAAPNDFVPILSYNNSITHFGEHADSYYILITTSSTKAGTAFDPTNMLMTDKVVIFDRNVSLVTEGATIDMADGTTVTTGSGGYPCEFAVFENAPWRELDATGGWPDEYAAVLNPDLFEAWGSTNANSWDPPATSYYMYFGTYDNTNDPGDYGVLTPVGSVSGGSLVPSDMRYWTDDVAPMMVKDDTGSQVIDLDDLRKNFTCTLAGVLTGARDPYTSTVLEEYDWSTYPLESWEDNQEVVIHLEFPQAFDISGVTYNIYLANTTVLATSPTGSFFSDPNRTTLKTGVDLVSIDQDDFDGNGYTFDEYDSSGIPNSTGFALMVNPVDDNGNTLISSKYQPTTKYIFTPAVDITAPDPGSISGVPGPHADQVVITVEEAEDESYPLGYYLFYAKCDDYSYVEQDFVDDMNSIIAADQYEHWMQNRLGGVHSWDKEISDLDSAYEWYFCVYVYDPNTNHDWSDVIIVEPAPNSVPVWDDTEGIIYTEESSDGGVTVYWQDADDSDIGDTVSYLIVYGPRDALTEENPLWTVYDDGDPRSILSEALVSEASASGSGTAEDPYYYEITGLTNTVVYQFGVRAQDNRVTPGQEKNANTRGSRPTEYTLEVLDDDDCTGYFPDMADYDYSFGGSQTRIGISYVKGNSKMNLPESGEFADEVRYVYYDTLTGWVKTPGFHRVADREYDDIAVALGETSITYLQNQLNPAIVYYSSSLTDDGLGDQHEDGDGLAVTVGHTASTVGTRYAVQYAENCGGSIWFHDTVDWFTGDESMSQAGFFNGITAISMDQKGGQGYMMTPFVSYSGARQVEGGPYYCRFLSRETADPDPDLVWRPFYNNGTSKTHDYSPVMTFNSADDFPIGWANHTDIGYYNDQFLVNVLASPLDNGATSTYFGNVVRDISDVVKYTIPKGWGFIDNTSTPDYWDAVPMMTEWYIHPSYQTVTSEISKHIYASKMASWEEGLNSGYGAICYTPDGPYWIDESLSYLNLIEDFDTEQTEMTVEAMPKHRQNVMMLGLAFNNEGGAGVVYPCWDSTADCWVLRVAEKRGTIQGDGTYWEKYTILYDDDDPYVSQGYAPRMAKIAYLHTGDWVVVYNDTKFHDLGDETYEAEHRLMGIVEP